MVSKIAKEKQINLEEISFIGDNLNDISALNIVGRPFVYRPKHEELKNFPHIDDFRELNEIIENEQK